MPFARTGAQERERLAVNLRLKGAEEADAERCVHPPGAVASARHGVARPACGGSETMRTVMCFGDSLTWGFNPTDGTRYPYEERWPGVMEAALGDEYHVIEEALNGRTTMVDPPFVDGRSGKAVLPILLESHAPLDAVIVMLGTNDLQAILHFDAAQVAWGCGGLLRTIMLCRFGPDGRAPRALLVTPPPFGQLQGAMGSSFLGREEESRRLPAAFAPIGAYFGAVSFNSGDVCQASSVDGIHPDAPGQRALGHALAEEVRRLLG